MSDRGTILDEGSWSQGLTAAIRAVRFAARRAPTDDDRPPPSTFPITPAARAALALTRVEDIARRARLREGRRRRTYGADA